VQKINTELRQLGVQVLVISFATPAKVAEFLAESPQPFIVLSDDSQTAYRAFGLAKASVGSMLHPAVIGRYLLHMARGWRPKRSGGADVLQLGGDFFLDQNGVLRYAHPSAEPTDRPSAAALLQQARMLCGGPLGPSAPD